MITSSCTASDASSEIQKNHDLDKEIDFLIIHPKRGLLVLEVKGGRIEVEGGSWYSIDRFDKKHELPRSPFEQAKSNLYALRDKIAETPATRPFQDAYRWHRGVALPSVTAGRDGFGTEASRDIVIDSTDLHSLELAVQRIMGSPGQKDSLPDGAIHALVNMLKPTRKIDRLGLGYQVISAGDEIIDLTREQYSVLDTLQLQRHALISGCAGSGKTMLAMEKARRLAAEGFQVLFTCFNENLGEWVREQFQHAANASSRNIHVAHYHGLARELCAEAGVDLPKPPQGKEESEQYYDEVMPDKLFEALIAVPERFDAIIADEGQDISRKWWDALPELLTDPEQGIFYIFYDDNQRLYQRERDFPFNEPLFPLTTNCRNTDRIHQRSVRYHKGTPKPRSSGLDGPEPEIVPVEQDNRVEALRKVFTRLFTEEHIPTNRVIILTPRSGTSYFKAGTKIGSKTLTWSKRPRANEVRVSSIYKFKGLESPIVILAELDRIVDKSKQDELLYVATSRAQSHLIVLGELPEPMTQLRPASPEKPDLEDDAEEFAEAELEIAAEPDAPVEADTIFAPAVTPEVTEEPTAEPEFIEVGVSASDATAAPVARAEAPEHISLAAAANVVQPVHPADAHTGSTEPRPNLPSPRIGRGDGGEGRIPEPLALPLPTNRASLAQEPTDRVVEEQSPASSRPAPSTSRSSRADQKNSPKSGNLPSSNRTKGQSGSPPRPPSSPRVATTPPPHDSSAQLSGNGWAVAGLLFGILALFIHFLWVAAIIASGIGLVKVGAHDGKGKASGLIGLMLGVLAVVLMLQ